MAPRPGSDRRTHERILTGFLHPSNSEPPAFRNDAENAKRCPEVKASLGFRGVAYHHIGDPVASDPQRNHRDAKNQRHHGRGVKQDAQQSPHRAYHPTAPPPPASPTRLTSSPKCAVSCTRETATRRLAGSRNADEL